MVVHTCNPSTQEAKAGGSGVQYQPRIPIKILSQKRKEGREGEREGREGGRKFLALILL
jgi:hypothetical protein